MSTLFCIFSNQFFVDFAVCLFYNKYEGGESMKERIKAIRTDAGISQTEFGSRLGVSRSAVINWEFGQNNPSTAMSEKICRTFDINPMYLSGESDVMHIPPDEDEEIIDRALENANPALKAMLISIVKKPDGWMLLADSILAAADALRAAGYETDNKKPEP